MFKCQKNKLWLEYFPNLVCSYNIIPLDDMTLAEQMNALTRIVLVITLILFLVNFNYSFLFLLLALLFIIILYYIQKRNMDTFKTEYFKPSPSINPRNISNPCIKNGNFNFEDMSSKRFCDDQRPLDGPNGAFNNPNWVSPNQKLAGPPNPKTKIAPVVVPPPADYTYWKVNNLVTPAIINEESNIDVYQSGYQVSTCCAPSYGCGETYVEAIPRQNPLEHKVLLNEQYKNTNQQNQQNQQTQENYQFPYFKTSQEQGVLIKPEQPGQVNLSCGYNPEQLYTAGLPTNLAVGNCPQDPVMKQFNENLFTQTIQPGVYTRNEINEPINANIGISFTQQIPPTTCKTDIVTGQVNYTEHDPRIIEPAISEPNMATESPVTEGDIYDPRFSGYGTSYRSYNDNVTGQPRFYYDDVNAIRMPNYVVRSNIDNQPFADQYGPIPQGEAHGNKFNANIRALANDAFMTSTIEQRTNLQQTMMRKANIRQAQLRQAPIRTGGQRMLGGLGSCK